MFTGIVGYALAYRKVEIQIETPPQLALPRDAFDDRDDQDEWVHWIDYYSTADPVPNGPLVTWTTAEPPKKWIPTTLTRCTPSLAWSTTFARSRAITRSISTTPMSSSPSSPSISPARQAKIWVS